MIHFNPNKFLGVSAHQMFLYNNILMGTLPYHSFHSAWLADFRSAFFVPPSLFVGSTTQTFILNMGYANLRVQSPLVLTHLRKQVLKKFVQVFSFGSVDASFFIKTLGSSIQNLNSVYRGLHWFCSFLSQKSCTFINFDLTANFSRLFPF